MKALLIRSSSICTVLLSGCVALLSACHGMKSTPVPALIVEADVEAHRELSALMATVMEQKKIRLSASLFHTSSFVTLARRDLSGRVLGMPARFQLMLRSDKCELHKLDTEKFWVLEKVQCKASDSEPVLIDEHEHSHDH